MSELAIDIGTTLTKIVEIDENNKIVKKSTYKEKNIYKVIEEFNINIDSVSKIFLTGVGVQNIREDIYGIKTYKTDEFKATGSGAMFLSKKDNGIVMTIGTGTSFVKIDNNQMTHIGGTGVGGATLMNLCRQFTNSQSFEKIINISKDGNLSNVDLKIADICSEEIQTLPKDITAANFGKLNDNTKIQDIVLGIINMVFEVVGVIGAIACKNTEFKEVIVVGGLSSTIYAKEIFEKIRVLHGISFIIPKDAEYATAIGAKLGHNN